MKVLSVGIHADDCEYGMGATGAMLAQQGAEVVYLNIKPYQHHLGGSAQANTCSMQAAQLLGGRKIILEYEATKFFTKNEKTIREMEDVIREVCPDIVFMMHPKDCHIEHVECANATREALFAAAVGGVVPNEVYSYECGPHQTMHYFLPDLYINISDMQPKIKECLLSFGSGVLSQVSAEHLWREKAVSAQFRGHSSGVPYAEAFKIIKYPEGNHNFLLLDALRDYFRWGGTRMYYPRLEELF